MFKSKSVLITLILAISIILLIMDLLTSFEIKNQYVKIFVYLSSLIFIPTKFCFRTIKKFKFKPLTKRVVQGIVMLFSLIFSVIISYYAYASTWKTQTIVYQNGHLKFNTIEFQMKDLGARGYKKRTKEIIYVTPFFMIVNDVPENIERRIEWIKINKDVNELNLKFP